MNRNIRGLRFLDIYFIFFTVFIHFSLANSVFDVILTLPGVWLSPALSKTMNSNIRGLRFLAPR